MIAVMGAAGNVGSRVTERLLREGRAVRVLEHRRKLDGLGKQGAEVVTGDAVDPGDLGRQLEGAEAALVLLPEDLADPRFVANRSRMTDAIATALAGSGVGRVVLLSTVGAGLADAFGPPAGCVSWSSGCPARPRPAGPSVRVLHGEPAGRPPADPVPERQRRRDRRRRAHPHDRHLRRGRRGGGAAAAPRRRRPPGQAAARARGRHHGGRPRPSASGSACRICHASSSPRTASGPPWPARACRRWPR